MSEKLNKVIANLPQAFTTAEQKQARDNIGAQKAISYGYSASSITSIDGSAVGNPASITGVDHDYNLSGSGTSGSPLGLNSSIELSSGADNYPYTFMSAGCLVVSAANGVPNVKVYKDESSFVSITKDGIEVEHSANGVGGGHIWNRYGETLELSYNDGANYLREIRTDVSGIWMKQLGNGNRISRFGFGSAQFTDDSGSSWETVNPSSIRRWNSSLWSESANPLSYGYGGNQASAASQYNVSAGNWAARTLKSSGIPDMTLYGFQNLPPSGGPYMVNAAGAFVEAPQQTYFVYLYHETGSAADTLDTSFYPTGLTANARLDFVNLCSARSANIKTDTFHGNTATINPGESATMWYIAAKGEWTDGANSIPV